MDLPQHRRSPEDTVKSWFQRTVMPAHGIETLKELRGMLGKPVPPTALQRRHTARLETADMVQDLVSAGWRPTEIARFCQVKLTTVLSWRKAQSLPAPVYIEKLKSMRRLRPPARHVDMVLLAMQRHSDEHSIYGRGLNYLAMVVGLTVPTLRRYVKSLKRKGDIKQLNSEPGEPTRYLIIRKD